MFRLIAPKTTSCTGLIGSWLQEAGFYIGCVVSIVGTPGQLTITIAGAQNYAELQQLLQRENMELV